jgi:hypothetical protein
VAANFEAVLLEAVKGELPSKVNRSSGEYASASLNTFEQQCL